MTTIKTPSNSPLAPQRRAIIVGASSGIGAALARELAQQGYRVAAVARRESKLSQLCQEINRAHGPERACAYQHDVTAYAEIPDLFQTITAELGGLDLIVYVAGAQAAMADNEYHFEKEATMIHVNLLGAIAWLGQAAARFERAREGHMAAISSIAADRGRRANPVYNASKAGLDTYLEGLRNRLSRHGVSVTTIKPGFVDTVLLKNAPKTFWVISPEKAAAAIYSAIRARKQIVYVPARWRLVSFIISHIPSIVFRRLNI
jgi:decaprenylphospho-beta-D-erythro-pentofuranosid-2-ulose 2-reductase